MKIVVTSSVDRASMNILESLIEHFPFEKEGEFEGFPTYILGDTMIITTREELTKANHLEKYFMPKTWIFASRHESKKKIPCLTVHAPGNINQFGIADPSSIKLAIMKLHELRSELNLNYLVSLEATHHGPSTLEKPVTFIEIGSDLEAWSDLKACEVVSHAIMDATRDVKFDSYLGIGGPHYAPTHTRIVLNTKIAVGHILPSYLLGDITEKVFEEVLHRNVENINKVILDWKGMRSMERKKILNMCDKLGVEVIRERDIRSSEN
ncbi:MAG: D-aminoacyl-tRNA deacylase [Candidatus Hydrothermarchaeota archaeon]